MIHTALQLFKTLYRYGNRLTGAAPGRAARAASCGRSNFAIPLPLAGCLGRLFGAAGPSCFGPGKSPGVAGFEEGVEVGMRHVDGLAPLLAAHDPKAQPARQPLPALPAAVFLPLQSSELNLVQTSGSTCDRPISQSASSRSTTLSSKPPARAWIKLINQPERVQSIATRNWRYRSVIMAAGITVSEQSRQERQENDTGRLIAVGTGVRRGNLGPATP